MLAFTDYARMDVLWSLPSAHDGVDDTVNDTPE
jgi:hypothetical protein